MKKRLVHFLLHLANIFKFDSSIAAHFQKTTSSSEEKKYFSFDEFKVYKTDFSRLANNSVLNRFTNRFNTPNRFANRFVDRISRTGTEPEQNKFT